MLNSGFLFKNELKDGASDIKKSNTNKAIFQNRYGISSVFSLPFNFLI